MRNVLLENGKVVYALSPSEHPVSVVLVRCRLTVTLTLSITLTSKLTLNPALALMISLTLT